ncbi:unnamed protein product, partial [Adineta steineri]
TIDSPRANTTSHFRIFKVQLRYIIKRIQYCPKTVTENTLEKCIHHSFNIAPNTTFTLIDEDNMIFALKPIDYDNEIIFKLIVNPVPIPESNNSTPPPRPRHSWKYYGKMLLIAIFTYQTGIIMGILANEYGLFSAVAKPGPHATRNLVIKNISIDEPAIILEWIEGTSEYKLLLPVEKFTEEYVPLNVNYKIEIDTNNLKALQCLPNNDHQQTVSLSSNDLEKQLLRIIDSIQIKQNFGIHEQNLPRDEIIHDLYSPDDATSISLQQILIDSVDISARAFHRYRCKHMSIKGDDKNQLDSIQGLDLQFEGNESITNDEQ